jgi:outer membrane biogenesis lipoprotein LolB
MSRTAFVAALASVVLLGCAEKSETQQVTDAAKAQIEKRSKPRRIG